MDFQDQDFFKNWQMTKMKYFFTKPWSGVKGDLKLHANKVCSLKFTLQLRYKKLYAPPPIYKVNQRYAAFFKTSKSVHACTRCVTAVAIVSYF